MATRPRGRVGGHVNWSGYAVLTGMLWAITTVVLAAGWGDAASVPLALAAVACAAVTAILAAAGARQRRAHAARISDDLTAVASRLLRLEAGDGGPPRQAASPDVARDIAADLALLGRVVRDLAERVGDHEGRIDALGRRPGPDSGPLPAPEPADRVPSAPPVPRPLTTRDDFAKAASAILKKLGPAGHAARAAEPATERRGTVQAGLPDAGSMLAALDGGRIEILLQPVVTLPQRRTKFYEALARLRMEDGRLLPPAEFMPILEQEGRVPELDGFVLARAFAIGRHLAGRDSPASVSCNLSPLSLAHPTFFQAAEQLFESDRRIAGRIIFEVRHRDYDLLSEREVAALARLTGLGSRLVLDRCTDLRADWPAFVRRGFDWAKVDAALLLEPRPPGMTSALVSGAADAGIALVATNVERETAIPDLLDFDVPLAQGHAIAAERPVRSEVVAGHAALPAQPQADDARVSFREFLRRAG